MLALKTVENSKENELEAKLIGFTGQEVAFLLQSLQCNGYYRIMALHRRAAKKISSQKPLFPYELSLMSNWIEDDHVILKTRMKNLICKKCHGYGEVENEEICPICFGRGWAKVK